MDVERMTHKRVNGIKTGYWSPAKKEDLVQRLAAFENEEERRAMRPQTVFEKLTASPAVLGAMLRELGAVNAPWDAEFQKQFCSSCPFEDCDEQGCPHQEERNNPEWWLGLEAEERP